MLIEAKMEETREIIKAQNNSKASREEGITSEMVKARRKVLKKQICRT